VTKEQTESILAKVADLLWDGLSEKDLAHLGTEDLVVTVTLSNKPVTRTQEAAAPEGATP
jgi:hypothetical protein